MVVMWTPENCVHTLYSVKYQEEVVKLVSNGI